MIIRNLNILKKIVNKDKKSFNILTTPTHEGYQSLLDLTGHNFHMISGQGIKTWDYHTRQLPKNHYYHKYDWKNMPAISQMDMVLCQNRMQTYGICRNISDSTGIPLILLDHTEPPPNITEKQMVKLLSMDAHKKIFITEHNKNSWRNEGDGIVINHAIDTSVFDHKEDDHYKNQGVSVVNRFPDRDVFCGWNIWKEITEDPDINVDLYGDNPGISQSINDSNQLSQTLSSYLYYLNTSLWSPVPMSMLEAMACGLPVVSTAKQEIPNIIKNGYNGFISNNTRELRDHCLYLQNNPNEAREMGINARKTILENFNIDRFVSQWNEVFTEAYKENL